MFTKTYTTAIDDNGHALMAIRPTSEAWHVTETSVSVHTAVSESEAAIVFRGLARIGTNEAWLDALHEDKTNTGSSGDTSDTEYVLHDGETLYVEWVRADAGSTATLTITGSITNSAGDSNGVSE